MKMDLGCGGNFAKCIILFINIIFTVIGIVLLGFGIFLVVDTQALNNKYILPTDASTELITAAAIVILVVGLIILLISVVGCCATIKNNSGCLTFYSCILTFLLILQITAVIIAGVFYNKIIYDLGDEMLNIVKFRYSKPGQNDSTTFIDSVQADLQCCGVYANGPMDWKYSYFYNTTRQTVPASCCTTNGTQGIYIDLNKCRNEAYKNKPEPKFIYTEGCDAKMDRLVKSYVGVLIGVVVGLVVLQIVFIVVVCLLKSKISRGYEYV